MKKKSVNENIKSSRLFQKQDNSLKEEKLMNEIIDLKNAVNINWKILNEYIISNLDNKEDNKEDEKDKKEIEDLLKECKSLIDSNINVDEKIQQLKEENQEITEISQQFQYQAQKEYEDEKNKYIKLQMELTKKKAKLNDVENILQKTRAKSLFKDAKNEIYVIEPTRKHLEMHQEILSTTDAINQLENLGKQDNIKLMKLQNELEELQNQFNNIQSPVVQSPVLPVSPGGATGTPTVSIKENQNIGSNFNLDES